MTGKFNSTGNNEFLKKYNRARILDLVRIHGAISRKRLSELTGLSPTATGTIVSALLKKGYLYETGSDKSSGGRKPILLELKPGSCFSVGIDIDVSRVQIFIIDITGNIAAMTDIPVSGKPEPSTLFSEIDKAVESSLKGNKVYKEKLLGIGVSVPGLVEPRTGKIVLAPNLNWTNVETSGFFNSFTGTPVYFENESMASAIYENWLGECTGTDDFICINIGSGIGAGIFSGGKLYRGCSGTAGEVGHMTVDENGPICGCGNRGCLETLASSKHLLEEAEKRLGTQLGKMTLDKLIILAEEGNTTAIDIFHRSARYLGLGISYLVNILNPGRIIIGRDFTKFSHLVMECIRETVKRRSLKAPALKAVIAASRRGDGSSALGAGIIPLKLLFGRK